jgi:hypothetical protein
VLGTLYDQYETLKTKPKQNSQRLQRKRQQPLKKIYFSPQRQLPINDGTCLRLLESDNEQSLNMPSDQDESNDELLRHLQDQEKDMQGATGYCSGEEFSQSVTPMADFR